ncbi:hypothetical protein PENPOL_c028G09029 [Penicillium polonicum]|uniref:Uncharacterized protein n=1 Tax=Penicillium polonicum TaxID=60169 RepID=A0A1V6N6H2_PENPO|nr:hypothetical protein PENPOL_c028G09029 [Penicillium polonicum]
MTSAPKPVLTPEDEAYVREVTPQPESVPIPTEQNEQIPTESPAGAEELAKELGEEVGVYVDQAYYAVIRTPSVLARAPTSSSVGVLLVVMAPAPEPIVVTPTLPSTLNTTLRLRRGNTTCLLTRIMALRGRD